MKFSPLTWSPCEEYDCTGLLKWDQEQERWACDSAACPDKEGWSDWEAEEIALEQMREG